MKDILIIANFSQVPGEKGNGRFYELAEDLCQNKNNKVELLTTNFDHGAKDFYDKNKIGKSDFKFTMVEEVGYKKNVSLKRIYSHYVAGKNLKKYLLNREKPDVIYCAVPSLSMSGEAAKYAKKNKIRFIIDVQDLWPEAFKMALNIPVIKDILFFPFTVKANKIYKQADEIVAVSQTYCDRAKKVNKKVSKTHSVFLGTKLEEFDKNRKLEPKFRKNDNDIWLGYCGTLGHSYDLTVVFDALKILKDENKVKVPKFIIMGNGPKMEEFKEYANNLELDTVFTDRLEYPDMCSLLCQCDIVVNSIVGTASQSIINKHADYVAAGLPVINTQISEEYQKLVSDYNMGYNCKNHDAKDLAEKLEILINDKDLRIKMGKNARKCAEEKFDRKETYKEIINLIENN